MKILFLKHVLDYGGAAKMMSFVANSLSKKNHDVTILLYKGGEIQQKLEDKIKIINENIAVTGKFKHLKNICRIKRIISREKPDVIISFLHFPNLYATIIGKMLGIPVIISERGNPYSLKGLKDRMILKSFNYANGAVFQTEGAKSFYSKKLQARGSVIPNPIVKKNINAKFDIGTENHEIVFIARFQNIQKRQDLIVEALEKVINVYPDTVLKFYGTGNDLPMIENLVKNKHLENNVRFMGYTNTPEEVMVNSEVFVLTSDYEGIPNSLIEAMSVGMPVVSTDCDPGGARLLIENGVNGFIVPKNDTEAIAKKIIELFSNKELREKFSKEATKITERFTEEKIAGQWLEYIHKIAKK